MMKNWLEALTFVDDRYVEEANPQRAQPMRRLRRAVFVRYGAWVACLLLAVFVTGILLAETPTTPPAQPPAAVPQFQNPLYSAEEIASMFATYDDGTSSYRKIYAPKKQYLYLEPLSKEDNTFIYKERENVQGLPLDEAEFAGKIDTFLQNYAKMTKDRIPTYAIETEEDFNLEQTTSLRAIITGETIRYMSFSQSNSWHNFYWSPETLSLNGIRIEIDPTQSDEEILASLAPIREQLFALFNVSFDTMEVSRRDYYSRNGELASLIIQFYNKEIKTNQLYFGDRLTLTFHYPKDLDSKPLDIQYCAYRIPLDNLYERQKVTKISLEDAERLLSIGYVFGGHSCPICMAAQDKVDFTNYDFVSFEYETMNAFSSTKPTSYLPFYAFYKKIDTLPNGCNVYAKTYVPAFEVSGYKEYFEKQQEKHP